MRLLSQCYYAFIIVAYMKVEASGDYYIAWGSEEGAANENCMIYLQFVLWYNKGVWLFLKTSTYQSHNRSYYATVMTSVNQQANRA